MPREKVPFVIPVNLGLDLANPAAALQVGKLVRAQNKAPGRWGPRHGTTFVDRVSRGRGNPTFNGTTSYLIGYYNTHQMNLGRKFTIDVLYKIGTLDASDSQYIFCLGDANDGAVELVQDSDGKLIAWLHDDDDNGCFLQGTTEHANGDIVHVRISRSDGTVNLYVDTVLEDTDTTSLTSTTDMKVRAENMLIGKVPGYAGAGFTLFSGVFGGLYFRNYTDTNFAYAYSELPCPKSDDVLAAWTGELLESDTLVRDASRYNNPLECANISSGSRVPELHEPVQALKHATTLDGRVRNIVMVGGRLYAEVV